MYVLFHKTFVFARIHMFIEKLFNFSLHYLDTKICWMSEFFFLFVPYIFLFKEKIHTIYVFYGYVYKENNNCI